MIAECKGRLGSYSIFLSLVIVVASLTRTAAGSSPRESQSPKENQRDLVIGPLSLGELYDNMPDQTLNELPYRHLKERISVGDGPAHADVVKALSHCKIYLMDKVKAVKKHGKSSFQFADEEPMLAVRGKMSFDIKSKRGDAINLHLKEITFTTPLVTYANSVPQFRTGGIHVRLRVYWGAGSKRQASDHSFYSSGRQWTVSGAIRLQKQ
jgi:hypothetical protein